MASILSNLKDMLQRSESQEDEFEDDFIYWWDDVQEEEYVEEEKKTIRETIEENLVFYLHLAILIPIIPLIAISITENIYVVSALSIIIISAVILSYLLIRNKYVHPSLVLDENISLVADYDLTGNEELFFSKEQYPILDRFDTFRTSIVGLFREYDNNSSQLFKEVDLLRNMIDNVYRNIDQINLSIDNTVGSTANYQELKGYMSQVSKGIDNFTANFDRTLDTIADVSNILQSIGKQTTMLALNAGIEAAKAGQRGKGFEVVASNLRRLAQHAVDSSNRIESNSDEINNNARVALENITTGMNALEGMMDVNHSELTELNNDLFTAVQDLSAIGREFGSINSVIEKNQQEINKYRY